MADVALTDTTATADLTARAEVTARAGRGDARFHFLTWAAAAAVLLIFAGVIGSLLIGSFPAVKAIGIGVAIFLTELCPRPLRRPIGIAIELLAGIPSIIYGIWGLFVFAPWFQLHVQEPVVAAVGDVPVLGTLFGGGTFGIGVFTAGLILSIM